MSSHAASPASARFRAATYPTARRLGYGIAATLAVALAAHVALPLPFTPVPFTLQPLAVLLVGLLLGPLDGAMAMLAYLAEGAVGLPVFNPTGPGGLLQLLGPTGGFLLAYPAFAWLSGTLARLLTPRLGAYAASALGGTAAVLVLFASGASWLAHLHPLSWHALWIAAIGPFLPGEAVKVLIAAGIYRALHPNASR